MTLPLAPAAVPSPSAAVAAPAVGRLARLVLSRRLAGCLVLVLSLPLVRRRGLRTVHRLLVGSILSVRLVLIVVIQVTQPPLELNSIRFCI